METQKPLLKDEDEEEVDVHVYRSMIGSLMYLTSSRLDIMFAVCACARYQVNPKVSHLHVVKMIFRYLKCQPKLGLWYPKDSYFDLVAYTGSDYARASLDRKSTTRGCQYLRSRLILWQCKKQNVVANSTTEAEYVAASRKAKKDVRLMMDKLFEMNLELILLFWSTAMTKTINGESQIHARVDGKEIIITESSVRRDLQLADEDGVDCFPNSTIFENHGLMGTMASAIICLATNQKFNFSKLIFDSMIRNLDNASGKFLMYPRVRKGFSGIITNLFPSMLVQNPVGEGSVLPTDPQHTPIILESSSSQPQKTQKHRKPKRKNTQVPQPSGSTKHVTDEVVHKEKGDRLVRAATTASSLEVKHDSGNIDKTQSKATPNKASSPGTTSGGGPSMYQLTIKGSVLGEDKDHLSTEIDSLKRRVKKLEKKQRSRTHKLKRLHKVGLTAMVDSSKDEPNLGGDASKQGRIKAINTDEDITLVNDQDDADDAKMFDVNDLHGEEVFVDKDDADKEVNTVGELNVASIATTDSAAATIITEEVTLAKALVELKGSKPKVNGVFIQDPSESITTTTIISSKKSQDKGKGIMVEEPVKPKRKEKIKLDEEATLKLQAEVQVEFEEEQRLGRIVKIKSHLQAVGITAAHIDVNTALMELYKEVTAAQLEVSDAQELQRNILSVYYC
nr:uncharacterized mitochondrial protein AtMg00810-like [Tanacetum cinerariifolium]